MLSALITLFETIKNIAYFSLFLSYNTGKIIVSGITTSYEVFIKLFNTLWTLIVILEEDLLIFLTDVWNRIVFVGTEISNFTDYLSESVVSVFTGIKCIIFATSSAIITCFQAIITVITKVVTSIGTLIATVKHFVVLFGSGVWFAITLVPIFIVYVCMMITYYAGRAFEEIQSFMSMLCSEVAIGIKDAFTFVTDVPLESIAGIIIISCLIYALTVFHIALYSTLSRFTRRTLRTMYRYLTRLKTTLIRRNEEINDQEEESDSSNSEESTEPVQTCSSSPKKRNKELLDQGDRLCVICMERDKCILSMPCRHLSTCLECSNVLKNYQRTCPICRQFINYTIHVY